MLCPSLTEKVCTCIDVGIIKLFPLVLKPSDDRQLFLDTILMLTISVCQGELYVLSYTYICFMVNAQGRQHNMYNI